MKKLLDWQVREVVNIFDEVSLWSAPFGRLLLDNIPMKPRATILDIGFGTGFPLIELSQRFGEDARIIGIDIWSAAVERTKEKIRALAIENIEIIQKSAVAMDLVDESIDLVTSNLGINNFDERLRVYSEILRVMKPDGRLCITTNPVGTFRQLFDAFEEVLSAMNGHRQLSLLRQHIAHRSTQQQIADELTAHGFQLVSSKEDQTSMRFADARAVLDHSLIRIGFRAVWEEWFSKEEGPRFFEQLIAHLEQHIQRAGGFEMGIPMLYMEFEKQRVPLQ